MVIGQFLQAGHFALKVASRSSRRLPHGAKHAVSEAAARASISARDTRVAGQLGGQGVGIGRDGAGRLASTCPHERVLELLQKAATIARVCRVPFGIRDTFHRARRGGRCASPRTSGPPAVADPAHVSLSMTGAEAAAS